MNRQIKSISKELGFGTWLLHLEGSDTVDRMYISKFDPNENNNDDEYRIYFFIKEDGIQIVRKFRIKSYKYQENIKPTSKFYKEAEEILNTYFERNSKKHTYKAS